jgi:hypothetical protein
MLEPGTVKKIVKGEFALRGQNKLDLWKCCLQAFVRQREGAHVAARFPAAAPAHGVLLDPDMLRLTQSALVAVFNAVGYTGVRRYTFTSILSTILKRVTTIAYLPDTVPQKEGLVKELEEAILLIFDDAAAAHATMMKTAAPFSRRTVAPVTPGDSARSVIFASESSSGCEKVRELDEKLSRILEDLRLEPAMRTSVALRGVDGASSSASNPLQIIMRGAGKSG